MPSALRVFFIINASVILFGIWLTGFKNVHWLLFLPPIFLYFAGITGFCPGLMILKKLGLKGP